MKRCIEIAQSCVDSDPDKRPTIGKIVEKLTEIETMIENESPILKEPRSDPHPSFYKVVEAFNALPLRTHGGNSSVDDIDMEVNTLESILEGDQKPSKLSYELLRFITENFAEELIIGKGGFSKIYKSKQGIGRDAKHGSRSIAVKKLFGCNGIDDWRFYQEVKTVTMAQHRNVVQFLGHCSYTEEKEVEYKGKIVLAEVRERLLCFEYLSKGSLDKYISDASRGLEWRVRYQIIKGICEGLHYLHGKRIVHLDLKPHNILLDDDMVPKITDFGLARCFGNAQTRSLITIITGTRGYMPPETYDQLITLKADIYALGVVIAEILTGEREISLENVLQNWRHRLGTSEMLLEQVRACAEISIACIEEEPSKRPDTQVIIERLVASEHNKDNPIEKGMSSIPSTGTEQRTGQPRHRPPLPPRFGR